jgi:hypothetical protein
MHHNENCDRLLAVDRDGLQQYRVVFPKRKKGGYTVQTVREPYTIGEYTSDTPAIQCTVTILSQWY